MGLADREAIVLRDRDAIRHLLRLTVGLESAVLGEDQVLHQVREVLADLVARGGDASLIRLFETAVAAGRRVRARHPAIDRNLGELAVRWLESRVGPLAGQPVVVVGAGRMGSLAAAAVARRRPNLTIGSRSIERARLLARRVGARAVDLSEAATVAADARAAIVALNGPWSLDRMSRGPSAIVDLSFPSAIASDARLAAGERFADVDRIFRDRSGHDDGDASSADFRASAEAIVDEAVASYEAWSAGRSSTATLRALRTRSEARRASDLERLFRRLPDLEPRERELVAAFSEQLVAGLLHAPSASLRDDADGSVAVAAQRLFRL
jgi:glutamyl-tRNA reductase